MTKPLVDVVIPTNRHSPFLAEALATVVGQTYPHWRLILVDDGCPDPDFLTDSLRDIPHSTVVRQPPQGPAAARNAGIRAGNGELIAFLDDDDVWAPEKLATQVAAMEEADGSIGCYTAGWYMDGDGVTFGVGWPATPTTQTQFLSGATPTPRIVSLMARRDAWAAIGGFDPSYVLAEDNDFILRLVQHGHLACVSEPMVGYRRHGSNSSVSGGLDGRRANRRILREHIEAARQRGDAKLVGQLLQNLTARRKEWAAETLREIVHEGRHGRYGLSARLLAWSLRETPRDMITVGAEKAHALLRRQHYQHLAGR